MPRGHIAKDPQDKCPDADEEDDDHDNNRPCWRLVAGPEIEPVPAIGCREPVILNEDSVEKPLRAS